MSTTIYDLLDELREASLDERDKGDKFEHLVKAYLLNDPEWAQKFTDVWLWSEWPGRQGRPDTGIDLVAANRDDERLTAIQCKFYAAGATVSKSSIDSFISASAGEQFGSRLIFDTSAGWSGNAEETLVGVAQRIDVSYLADAAIDWGQFSWATPHVVVPTGKKALRPHQERALNDVTTGLAVHDRGKLVMACGTGKTFTSLRIAEKLVGEGGRVLFLVPSIQLLSQSLREWMANAEVDIRPFAVCSDVRVGRTISRGTGGDDEADLSTIDLTEPATTSSEALLRRMSSGRHGPQRMTVVFATYQSIDVIIQAQAAGLGGFDLVICDEAHRSTGVTLSGAEQSAFVKVHDAHALNAAKRLYMTATPRVFGEDARRKAADADAVLADMSDEDLFGPELHRLGFGDAVEADLLTDYKVLVLAVDEHYVAENFQQAMSESGEMKLDEAARLLGCWNGLAKNFSPTTTADDPDTAADDDDEASDERVGTAPMRTAVAFAQNIAASKAATRGFPAIVEQALTDLPAGRAPLRIEAHHVDGTMGIQERNAHLAWLKEDPTENVCRILTNARCLSEGVDVPALDAVLFLTPRGSQVDVVQSVGRVMRKAPGKELGYIILPVVVPSGISPEDALADNERYKVVWQVLQALRSHDDRFHALINQIELNKKKPAKIEIIPVTKPRDTDRDGSSFGTGPGGSGEAGQDGAGGTGKPSSGADVLEQTMLQFPAEAFRDAMYARIVAKVGERRYWETWAKDVADIAAAHTTRIHGLLADPASNAAKEFAEFLNGLRGNLNEAITADQAIEMLAQHLVTRPIFDALFEGYAFAATNPVARTMETMLSVLDEHNLDAENETLAKFYASVRRRVAGVDNAEGKQRILIELYDKFFATAFKKTVDKLGIVYTPVEIVDFILRSADDVLRAEFGQGLTDQDVHILDGFTGTGTFIVRLLQSGLIKPHDLARKYANELHANEILLLAYYIAAVNIEATYTDLTGTPQPFPGLILTDTFQSWEPDDRPDLNVFPENNKRLERLKALPITVIVGNPPYSSGQDSANDDNANEKYPALDEHIRTTYAERSTATNKNSLYDSYVRAIKWATLRIRDRGVIAFVTNGGWIDSNTADGVRKTLAQEFSTIYVYNLRGNRRAGGREGRPIWEAFAKGQGGSIATIAIVVLVKNPARAGDCEIHYAQVSDDTTAKEKVAEVVASRSVIGSPRKIIVPNSYGDWLNQRSSDFEAFLPIERVFTVYSGGLKTNRDAWCYSFSGEAVRKNMTRLVATYESDRLSGRTSSDATRDETQISWNRSLLADLDRDRPRTFQPDAVRQAMYRPFAREHVYFSRALNDMVYRLPALYPSVSLQNMGLLVMAPRPEATPAVLMVDQLPDLSFYTYTAQFFARWRYESVDEVGALDLGDGGPVIDGYRRIDNVTDEALARFTAAHPSQRVTKDDVFFYVYGLLHSSAYRQAYAADLKRVLPRIPVVDDPVAFRAFVDAGRSLVDLHTNYESVTPYPLGGIDLLAPGGADDYAFYAVGDKKMSFGPPNRSDKTVLQYNDRITLTGIPLEAYRYQLGSRSALEWVIDRYYVKTDRASGIVNDPNAWSREVGNPRYILELVARVVTVSVETMKIVDGLPAYSS